MAITLLAAATELPPQASSVVVGQSQMCAPEGFFMLIRRKKSVGAVRLENVKALKEQGTGTADYQSYYSASGADLSGPKALEHHGHVAINSLVGVGRLAVQTGNPRIRVGPLAFGYGFPSCVTMYSAGGSERDEGFEFAATDIKDIKLLDPSGPWRWYRIERDRHVTLPLSEVRQPAKGH